MKARIRDFVLERMEILHERLKSNFYYKEIREKYITEREKFMELCKNYKKQFEEYSDIRTEKESVEFYEAYLLGCRDCIEIASFLSSSTEFLCL